MTSLVVYDAYFFSVCRCIGPFRLQALSNDAFVLHEALIQVGSIPSGPEDGKAEDLRPRIEGSRRTSLNCEMVHLGPFSHIIKHRG